MRRARQLWRLATSLLIPGLLSSPAFAQEGPDLDAEEEAPAKPAAAEATPAAADKAPAPAATEPAPAAPEVKKPKVGDTTISGYLRGGFGASSYKGRQTCFSLALPGGMVGKYRLGNECEIWSETEFKTVAYAGDDGVVSTVHFMPTVFIPTTYIGYSPTATTSSPAMFTTATGATLAFPNLYIDLKGISWLGGGTAWVGTRYYKRESIYINDFFYWNPSGVGAGIEDINVWKDIRVSYGAFAVDGQTTSDGGFPPLPARQDFGVRNDLQIRGIKPYSSGEFQIGFQYIADYSDHKDPDTGVSVTHGGWGVTLQHVQTFKGGQNKLAFQYGSGGGTGFGTLARFYYPDFSLYQGPSEKRLRFLDVLTVQPNPIIGGQFTFIYQRDDLSNASQSTIWTSGGGRISVSPIDHFKILAEVGYDRVAKNNGSVPQFLLKATGAVALSGGRELMSRPEIRLFATRANWNETARGATVDSGQIYNAKEGVSSGWIYGLQGETWF
jgi:maltoporin